MAAVSPDKIRPRTDVYGLGDLTAELDDLSEWCLAGHQAIAFRSLPPSCGGRGLPFRSPRRSFRLSEAIRGPTDSRAMTKKVIDERISFSNGRPGLGWIFCQMSCAKEADPWGAWSLLPPTTEMPRGKSGSAEIPPDSPLTLVLDQESQPILRFPIPMSRSTDTTRISSKPATCWRYGRSFGVQILGYRSLFVPGCGCEKTAHASTNACPPH